MCPFPVVLEKTAVKNNEVTLSPTHNNYSSMLQKAKGDKPPGINEWINKTRAEKSRQEQEYKSWAGIG
jgi:hypothetical protein